MIGALVAPAFHTAPTRAETLGPEVAGVCELASFPPDPEQRLLLDDIFGLDAVRRPSAKEVGVIAPRQNIKTGLLKQCALGWLFITGQKTVVWSAHEFDTAAEAFRDLRELIDGSDVLRRRVLRMNTSNGKEFIELTTGQRVKFKARTKTGGRGLTGDKTVLDEAFALTSNHMGSLVPTMAARPHGQLLYASSAGLADSAILRTIRDRGRGGDDPRLVYAEWCDDLPGDCADGEDCTHVHGVAVGCRLDDPARWARANSQLHRRIEIEAVQLERRALPPNEFGRERHGWWDDPADADSAELAIPAGLFDSRRDPLSAPLDPVVLAIDVSPARTASISAAGWRRDGRKHLEVVQTGQGTGWVVDVIARLVEAHDPAALLLDEIVAGLLGAQLRAAGIEPVTTSSREMAQASMGLVDDLTEDRVRHRSDQPLVDAAGSAGKRDIGDGWAFNRRGIEISSLVAAALASWGLESLGPPKPPTPMPRAAPPAPDQYRSPADVDVSRVEF